MRVILDHQIFLWQRFGGASRYFAGLIESYLSDESDSIDLMLPFAFGVSEHLVQLGLIERLTGLSKSAVSKTLLHWWYKIKTRQAANLSRCDLVHPTYYDPYILKIRVPYVLTIFDMIHECYAEVFPRSDRTAFHKSLLTRGAARVISISQSTKREIVERLDIPESKIDVIHLAVDPGSSPMKPKFEVPNHYILYVGRRDLYKNFSVVLKALADNSRLDPQLKLVCVGGGSFSRSEMQTISKLQLEKSIYLRVADDQELDWLYSHAAAFIFPSLCEGFGLPILEAFRNDCPCILSDIACFREVAGDAALYFSPNSEEALRDTVGQLLESQDLSQLLTSRGKERLLRYSLKNTARQTLATYQTALNRL